MTTMIALVGDQPQPNFLPARYYQPAALLLVYTSRTRQKYEYLKATLQKEMNVYGLETDPYNIPEIEKALDNELDNLVSSLSQSFIFNLTGGTKTMSFAAYQVAAHRNASMMYLQSEGKQTRVYHYTWEQQQLRSVGNELLPECMELHDVFDLHFGPNNWQECGAGRREGSPFEDALAYALRKNGYEVMVGVHGMNGQIDVDVALRWGNQYGIIEAKMGKNGGRLDGIKQLSSAARHLGTYSQTFYVVTVPAEPAHVAITEASNIQVISLASYIEAKNFSSEDEAMLLDSIGKKVKG